MEIIGAMRDVRFLAGVLCGIIFTVAVGALLKPRPVNEWDAVLGPARDSSIHDSRLYDTCLLSGRTVVACDAQMRLNARDRAADAPGTKYAAPAAKQ